MYWRPINQQRALLTEPSVPRIIYTELLITHALLPEMIERQSRLHAQDRAFEKRSMRQLDTHSDMTSPSDESKYCGQMWFIIAALMGFGQSSGLEGRPCMQVLRRIMVSFKSRTIIQDKDEDLTNMFIIFVKKWLKLDLPPPWYRQITSELST